MEPALDLSPRLRGALASAAAAYGAGAVGAFAVGALSVGAVAVGAIAIGRMSLREGRVSRLVIDELEVRVLRVGSVERLAD